MFNTNSRKKNILLSSFFGVTEQFISYFITFIFRTVFIHILSKNYLGISGLFTNVLQIFSLAELGIGGVISYRMYKPIKKQDITKCAELLQFYKKIYHCIFVIILLMGMMFYPFLDKIIADTSEVPADINLNAVYWLYVIQSATSYLCVYMQSLLSADQKGYIISFANTVYRIMTNVAQIIVLVVSKNYMLSLITGILINVMYNIIFSIYIKQSYKEIFDCKSSLSQKEKILIYKDTGALFCHKIGYTVVKSTDSIILSKYIGVVTLGIYSNYTLIVTAIDNVLNKLFGSFVSTIGNISIDKSKEQTYNSYRKLFFIDMWFSSFCSICLFILINHFIELWLDASFLLKPWIVLIITINLFLNASRIINGSFVNANGLFVKDRIRPLVEALLNLVVSVVLVKRIGIGGIFVGTIIGTALTAWWREPIILYKYLFNRNVKEYFIYYVKWVLLITAVGGILYYICREIPITILGFITKMVVCTVIINLIYVLVFRKSENYLYFKNIMLSKIKK